MAARHVPLAAIDRVAIRKTNVILSAVLMLGVVGIGSLIVTGAECLSSGIDYYC